METAQKTSPDLDAAIEEVLGKMKISEELKEGFKEELPLLRERMERAFNANLKNSLENAIRGVRRFIEKWVEKEKDDLYKTYMELMHAQDNEPHDPTIFASGYGEASTPSAAQELRKIIKKGIPIREIIGKELIYKGQIVTVKAVTTEGKMVLINTKGKSVGRAVGASSVELPKN